MSGKPLSKVAELPVKRINIEKLDFDLDNARFLPNVKMTSEKAYKMLRKIGNIDDLIKQIISSEGITDPLLVLKIGSRFVVKEGNRRLAACKYVIENPNKLNFEKLIQGNIKNIPCKIVPRGYKEIDIRLLLLTIHIRAKQDWRLFNRAHYIVELNKKFGKTSDEIAYYGVMSKSTVTKTIRSYERTIEYKNKYPKDESWSTKYTYFYQLYTSKNLEAFRDVKSNIYKFSTWVYNKKFKDYQDIRDLYKILNNEKALIVFENTPRTYDEDSRGTSFKEAIKIVENEDPGLVDKNFKILKKSIDVINRLTLKDISNIRKDENKIKYIEKLHKKTKLLYDEVRP